MFRSLLCIAVCALSVVTASSVTAQSGAQSSVQSDIFISGKPEHRPSSPLGPPQSLTRPYEPRTAAATPAPGLLVDDETVGAAPAPIAGITVTSPTPLPRTAASDLGAGRPVISVTNGKGTGRE